MDVENQHLTPKDAAARNNHAEAVLGRLAAFERGRLRSSERRGRHTADQNTPPATPPNTKSH